MSWVRNTGRRLAAALEADFGPLSAFPEGSYTGTPPANGGTVYDHPRNVPQAVGRITFGPRIDVDTLVRRHVEGDNDNAPAVVVGYCDHGEPIVLPAARKGDWIQTFTGRKFWPIDPRPDEVNIDDIAHALSMLCRYGGHCLKFYSVAEHSVHVAQWLFDNGYPWETILAGLLHDATEAYVADVPRPLKQSLPTYKDVEIKVWRAIAARYGLDAELPAEVHEADNRILADEIQQNMKPMEWHNNYDGPLGVELQFWTPAQAEHEFLAMFRLLERKSRVAA